MDKSAELDILLARSLLKARIYRMLAVRLSLETSAWRAEDRDYAEQVVQSVRDELYERANILDPGKG